jgi:endonuclease III
MGKQLTAQDISKITEEHIQNEILKWGFAERNAKRLFGPIRIPRRYEVKDSTQENA